MHPVPLDIHASIGRDPEARIDRGDRERARLPVLGIVDAAAADPGKRSIVAIVRVVVARILGRWRG